MTHRRRAQVISDPSLQRDLSSNAIVNTNAAAYQARMAHKRVNEKKNEEIAELRGQLNDLRSKYDHLAEMIKQALKK